MSEHKNCTPRDFSAYDAMETPELEAILRQDAEATGQQESDTDLILHIMEVLASRKNTNHTGNTAQLAWESFEKNYLPFEEEDVAHISKPKTVQPWVRRLAAIAAAIVLVLGLSATAASALSWDDIWNAVAKWAKETFSFVSNSDTELTEPENTSALEFSSLQEALGKTEQQTDFIPNWIPKGYVLEKIIVDENPIQSIYIAHYKNGEKEMKLTVRSYTETDPEKIEIGDNLLEIYEFSGTDYYIFQNDIQLRASWAKDSYECYISGELTMDEIKTMIDSIGKG